MGQFKLLYNWAASPDRSTQLLFHQIHPKGGERKKMKTCIGIDIGKKKCDYYIVGSRGKILECGQYNNNREDAKQFANQILKKYGTNNQCTAACETTDVATKY